jgi:hypothetical protein
MTWYVTWPTPSGIAYEEARNKSAAEARAKAIVDNRTASHATFFEVDGLELSA